MPTKPNNNKTNKPSLLSSAGLLIALNLVVKPIWIFGIDRTVQLTAANKFTANTLNCLPTHYCRLPYSM
ncbi:MAG: hypothetical protein IPG29_02865 [Sphingobacteriales bacterium]|nr:hypothetical protein [Sphingobacteriales bacterium]